MPEGDIPRFNEKRDEIIKQLNQIEFKEKVMLAKVDVEKEKAEADSKKVSKSNP